MEKSHQYIILQEDGGGQLQKRLSINRKGTAILGKGVKLVNRTERNVYSCRLFWSGLLFILSKKEIEVNRWFLLTALAWNVGSR